MAKKLPVTPRSKIHNALRKLWLQSRERAAALKTAEYRCERCGVKQSKAVGKEQKIEVHHKEGIGNWKAVIDNIRMELLPGVDKLECLCPECHRKEHGDATKEAEEV